MITITKKLRALLESIFPNYTKEIEYAVSDCKTLLDVGCGTNSPVQFLQKNIHKTGVDIWQPSLEISKSKDIHDEYIQGDILKLSENFKPRSFECLIASELIEHLEKDDGFELLRQLEKVASKRVVITTPQGFLPQGEYGDNPWQFHRSGWDVSEMRNRGYKVIGFNGAKFVWNIKFLWRKRENAFILTRILRKMLVVLTQLYTRNHPEHAFQMLCVKEIQH
ncbi:MAG: class I SAM-dependent methyltransferase [Candidatus Paceibacterota bacterium]